MCGGWPRPTAQCRTDGLQGRRPHQARTQFAQTGRGGAPQTRAGVGTGRVGARAGAGRTGAPCRRHRRRLRLRGQEHVVPATHQRLGPLGQTGARCPLTQVIDVLALSRDLKRQDRMSAAVRLLISTQVHCTHWLTWHYTKAHA